MPLLQFVRERSRLRSGFKYRAGTAKDGLDFQTPGQPIETVRAKNPVWN
jgi:hypothetical protein